MRLLVSGFLAHRLAPQAPARLTVENRMTLSPDLLSILVCPQCKGDLEYNPEAQTLTCQPCRLRFRVVDDIPLMLVEKAEKF